MKKLLLLSIAFITLLSCNNTKKVVEETPKPSDFDKSVINDNITVSNGRLIAKTRPVSELDKKSVAPQVPENITPVTVEINPPKVVPQPKVEPMTLPLVKNITLAHQSFNTLLQNNVSANGNVNYEGFKRNRKVLSNYIKALGENIPQDDWTQNEKLAYWMNAYNAMTIDLILRNWPVESIKDIKKPWDQRYWKLGDKYYNLEEIEHQILRKMGDARIHFGINCASFSCPPLLNEAFTAAKVASQLNIVATKFINDSSRNMISENSIEISKIFDWFSKDFKQNGSVIDYLNKFSEVKISEDAKVRYMDYNWELNK
ncbi:DUF547 domain-containing protein [Patiriisocius marinus]|uniref:DUF547 domain-containing protein n=1 Tax=Patiriisocius marinus TaxID=1397112 RepID=A0A5J4IXL6_9FLAO|nr:DUF547 domain-containing protein [Patiriisocius marinus]GER58223.1 hypothetical protein ULMA_03310 [Patiriisocius marinus]